MTFFWTSLNCRLYLAAFAAALARNSNFNLILVGVIYLIPLGIDPECLQHDLWDHLPGWWADWACSPPGSDSNAVYFTSKTP